MFLSIERLAPAEEGSAWIGEPLRRPQLPTTARGEHARLLQIAAARRLRAQERASLGRHEDAAYWKTVACAPLLRAALARISFNRLP